MRTIVVLASLMAIALPADVSAQAQPPAPLGLTAVDIAGPSAPAPFLVVGSSTLDAELPIPSAPGSQEARRPSILKHLALGVLAGVLAGTVVSVSAEEHCHQCVIPVDPDIAATGAVLGALVGLVIWNIQVSS